MTQHNLYTDTNIIIYCEISAQEVVHWNCLTRYFVCFKRILLYGVETWTKTKREDSKIQAMEMKSSRAILNKTMKDRIRNSNVRLELEVDEIKNGIQKSRLRWFGCG